MRTAAIVCVLVTLPVLAIGGWLIWRVRHLVIAFAVLAGAAHAQHVGPFYALAGDVLVMPPAPVEDPGRVAQAAEVNSQPVVPAPVPVAAAVNSNPPPVALNPLAPLVPPTSTPQPSRDCKCDKAFWSTIIATGGATIVVPIVTWLFVHFTAPTPMGAQL